MKKYGFYEIYQVNAENKDYLFWSPEEYEAKGITPRKEIFDLIYASALIAEKESVEAYLEDLFYIFNMEHPDNYYGHSLSVGDVIGINAFNENSYYMVDRVGFKKLEGFEEKEMEKTYPGLFGNAHAETLDEVKRIMESDNSEEFFNIFSERVLNQAATDDDIPRHKWDTVIQNYVTLDKNVRAIMDDVVCAFTGWTTETLLNQSIEEYKDYCKYLLDLQEV